MVDLVFQFMTSFVLILGIIIGENLASRAFGRPKKTILYIFELAIFVLVLVLANSLLVFQQMDIILMLAINAMTGVISAIVSRALSSGLGYLTELPSTISLSKYSNEERLIINLLELMCKYGVDLKEGESALAKAGIKRNAIHAIIDSHNFKIKIHPLVKEVAKLEEEVKELKEKLKKKR